MREAPGEQGPDEAAAHPAPDPGKFRTRRTCLFLDVDGTLTDLVPTPGDVRIGSDLIALLCRIHAQLDGALALVSGRPLAQLDRLFAPLRLPAAGINGFERRGASQEVYRPTLSATLNKATAIEAFMTEEPFEGRTPIYIGDDLTEFDGFGAVRRNGGVDIGVGDRVSARWYLPDPPAVRDWLGLFASQVPIFSAAE